MSGEDFRKENEKSYRKITMFLDFLIIEKAMRDGCYSTV